MKYLVRTDQARQLLFQKRITLETILKNEHWEQLQSLYQKHNLAYDIFRVAPEAHAILCSRQLGYIASELFNIRPLFVAFSLYPLTGLISSCWEADTAFLNLAGGFFLSMDTIDACYPTKAPSSVDEKWLIAFASSKTRYHLKKNEPLSNQLKRMGCSAGDLLNPNLHPRVA